MTYATGGNVRTKEAAITAQNQFTDWVRVDSRSKDGPAAFTASIIDDSTTFSATWTIQARRVNDSGVVGSIIDLFTSSALSSGGVQTASLRGLWEVRVGVKTGNFTAGTAVAAIDW